MHSLTVPHAQKASLELDVAVDPDESAAMLCLSILDQRMATRNRYDGAARAHHVAEAVREARMALDGATIDDILERRSA